MLVVCLCADWCDVCSNYRSSFEQVQAAVRQDLPQARFIWLDIEDEADLLHPLDVEDFPTLLIAVSGPKKRGAAPTAIKSVGKSSTSSGCSRSASSSMSSQMNCACG